MGDCNDKGYGRVGAGGKTGDILLVHRVMYAAAHGIHVSDAVQVCHHCDNPPCARPSHLFNGSNKENCADAQEKGRVARGLRLPQTVLTDEEHRTVRERYAAGNISQRALAAMYGVKEGVIQRAVTGKPR
jgi:ribosome-binding protein aMBF1 (putative translation factor)